MIDNLKKMIRELGVLHFPKILSIMQAKMNKNQFLLR